MTDVSELPEPVPRFPPLAEFREWISDYPLRPYTLPLQQRPVDLFEAVLQRRTSRTFSMLSESKLSALLFYTAKTISTRRRNPGPDWEHRPLPASGGCHAVQILIVPPIKTGLPLGIYDPRAHGCRTFENSEAHAEVISSVSQVLEVGDATLLIMLVDPFRISGHYENWESLVWRDSGVLLGGLSIVSTALSCSFCPLGISGSKQAKLLLKMENVIGVGACLIGG